MELPHITGASRATTEMLEEELLCDCEHFSKNALLPEKYHPEPGAFVRFVIQVWSQNVVRAHIRVRQADSRYRSILGDELTEVLSLDRRPLKESEALLSLQLIFSHWRWHKRERRYVELMEGKDYSSDVVIRNAVTAMYSPGLPVRCRANAPIYDLPYDVTGLLLALTESGIRPITREHLVRLYYFTAKVRVERVTPEFVRWLFKKEVL